MEMFPPESILPHEIFEQEKKNKVSLSEIEDDEALVIVLSVRQGIRKKKGVLKLPALVHGIEYIDSRCHKYFEVDFTVIDSKYKGGAEYRDRFDRNGYWNPRWIYQRFQDGVLLARGYFTSTDAEDGVYNPEPSLTKGQAKD